VRRGCYGEVVGGDLVPALLSAAKSSAQRSAISRLKSTTWHRDAGFDATAAARGGGGAVGEVHPDQQLGVHDCRDHRALAAKLAQGLLPVCAGPLQRHDGARVQG